MPVCSADCAYTRFLGKTKVGDGIQLIPFVKLYILAVELLCLEAGVPFANSYKGIVYLIRCVPAGLHSPEDITFFFFS